MKIQDILQLKSMSSAKLVAGKNGIDRQVSGVNVLEATDISNWGRAGEVILTSFFALQNLNDEELETFFEKLFNIEISAVIIKIDRLVTHIPNKISELCNRYMVPLIQIGREVKYETIILEILGPIVNRNISLLNRYYEVHGDLTRMALKRPSLEEILREFQKMIQRDVSFINVTKGKITTTNDKLWASEIKGCYEVETKKYMNFRYERKDVIYKELADSPHGTQIHVNVPYLGYDEYELVVHERDELLSPEDFMVLENGVKFMQMELLKKFVVSQNISQQKNNIIGDLLNDRLYEEKDVDEVLDSLGVNKYKYYQVALIKICQKNESKILHTNIAAGALRSIKLQLKINFPNMVFMEKTDRVVFMQNFTNGQDGIRSEQLVKIMDIVAEEQVMDEFHYNISISTVVGKNGIPKANKEALDTQNVLRLFYNEDKVMAYDDLGIYKLFLDANSLGDLKRFIAPKLMEFRESSLLLFETLGTFLDTNQNYNTTAERLFLHPKTVRYRIDKIKNMLDLDFANPEQILQIQIASRVFKLIDGRKNSD